MNKSYLVTGAKLRCMWGSKPGTLVISEGHNVIAGGRPKANCSDSRKGENIPEFGICGISSCGRTCRECMSLADKWINTSGSSWKLEKLNGDTALTMDSILLCRKGGIIVPETSGQGDVRKIDWKQLMARYPILGFAAMLGKMGCSVFGFDPINLNTGNFIYEKEDLVIHGITTLSFHITYNSMEEYSGGSLGEGWHHNYEISVDDKGDGMLDLHLGDGRVVSYRRSIGNLYTPLLKGIGLIKQEPDGYHYAAGKDMEYTFDKQGRLLTRKDRNGNTDRFVYNSSGQLCEARGANGGILYYRYNKEGNLYHVSDHTGREVCLRYSYRVLQQYINPSGQTYTYQYNENLRLESVTTPRGIEGVRNVYDGANRVISQTLPDGGTAEFLYDDEGKRTYARDQNGYITSYESDDKFRNIRTLYKDGEERYAYNDNDQRTLYVDKNGNKTQYSYDEQGNLIKIQDALGIVKNFTYNTEGKLLTASIEGDQLLENIYDKDGHLIRTTDALGRSRKTVYDDKGLPVQIILPDGSSIELTHDERGNISSITNAGQSAILYEYDALNRVIQVTDSEGNQVSYQYDERDHLLSETNPEGAVRSYVYDASGRPVKTTDFDGGVMLTAYNVVGKPEKITDKEGSETKISYDPAGNISEEVSPSGTVSVYQYDRNNRLIQAKQTAPQQEEPAERVTEYTYDPAGNLLRAQAGDGKEVMTAVSYEYDALNRVTAVTSPAGGRTVYTYDKKTGKISSITDAAGNQRTFRYNILGELTEETDIHGNTTRYEYNALGRPATITDGAGRTTRHTYLPGGRLEKTEYSDGTYISYEYDSIGRLKKKTDQSGRSITYTYDCMGRILTVSGSAGQEKSYTYDAIGNVTSVTDADGNVTKYAYTLNGRLKEVTDALGNKTEYAYDKADRLIYICQHGQAGEADRTTAYERDAFGQVVCIRDASGGEEHFCYDALGRMIEKTDREGLVTAYTYTPDGRPESILYGDGRSAQMEYTPLRQLAKVKDWLGETRIERSRQGNPVSITDHNGRTVRYEWGSMGQREGMIYPDGTKISWKYDSLLRPVQMDRTATGRDQLWTQYQYDGQGRLSEKRTSGGYITRWQYDETGLLGELSHTDASGILDRFQYTYDAAGNKTAIRKERRGFPEESGSYQYAYDGLHRLTGVEKDGKPLRSYQYDTFGNRTVMEDCTRGIMTVSEYDALNHLIRQEISKDAFPEDTIQKTYTYDKRGNLTGEYQDGDLLHGYAFNSMNRLEKAWDSEGTEAEYFYNALGQRTARSTAEETEEYLLDLTKPYHNLLELHKGKHRQTFYWDMNVSAMEDENRTLQYYLQDELGSPLRVLYRSGSGAAYGYDEFGADLYDPEKNPCAGRQYSRQGEHQPFGFTGYRYDDISGTYFAQAREYQPGEGRFTAEDILRGRNTIPKTLNRYGYCWGNPIQYVDVNGRDPITPQDIQKGFWESVLNAADRVVDDFSYQMDCIENDIKDAVNEGYQMVKDGVQTGLDFLGDMVDSGMQMAENGMKAVGDGIQTAVNRAKVGWNDIIDNTIDEIKSYSETIEQTTGIKTMGFSPYSGRTEMGISVGYGTSFVFDSMGNLAWQVNANVGGGFFGAGAGKSFMVTNAPSYKDLEGWGGVIGGSITCKYFNMAYDQIFMSEYTGASFYGKIGEYPLNISMHGEASYTFTIIHINIYKLLDILKFKDVGTCS